MARPPPTEWPSIPAPPGSKGGGSYSRIIPAEELQDYAAWKPGALGDPSAAPAATAWRVDKPKEETSDAVWQQRIAQGRKEGYEEGYRDGMSALESFKRTHAEQMQAQWEQRTQAFCQQLDAQWSGLEPAMADSLAQAAVLLARSVLHAELQIKPEHVLDMAREAVLCVAGSARRIELQVHPQDEALVRAALGDWLQSRGAHLQADGQVQRGGCLVQADIAQVDARLATRWSAAAAALGSQLPWQDNELDPTATTPP
jgi:flagellar assembly protein FliH